MWKLDTVCILLYSIQDRHFSELEQFYRVCFRASTLSDRIQALGIHKRRLNLSKYLKDRQDVE